MPVYECSCGDTTICMRRKNVKCHSCGKLVVEYSYIMSGGRLFSTGNGRLFNCGERWKY